MPDLALDLFAPMRTAQERPAQPRATFATCVVDGKLLTICAICGTTPAPFGFGVFKPDDGLFGRWACAAHRFHVERAA